MLKDTGNKVVNRVIISFQVRMNNALKSWKQNVSAHLKGGGEDFMGQITAGAWGRASTG